MYDFMLTPAEQAVKKEAREFTNTQRAILPLEDIPRAPNFYGLTDSWILETTNLDLYITVALDAIKENQALIRSHLETL